MSVFDDLISGASKNLADSFPVSGMTSMQDLSSAVNKATSPFGMGTGGQSILSASSSPFMQYIQSSTPANMQLPGMQHMAPLPGSIGGGDWFSQQAANIVRAMGGNPGYGAPTPPSGSPSPVTPQSSASPNPLDTPTPTPPGSSSTPAPSPGPVADNSSSVSYPDSSSHQSFVSSLTPTATKWSSITGIPAPILLAINASEGNWGRAGNELFGMKGSGTSGSTQLPTWEVEGGQAVNTVAGFANYNNPDEAYAAFWNLISTSPRYAPALASLQQGDTYGFLRNLVAGGYATDPTWGTKIMNIAQSSIAPLMGSSANGW